MSTNLLAGRDTGWLGIPGHVLGMVRGSKPRGTNNLLCPNLAGEMRETKKWLLFDQFPPVISVELLKMSKVGTFNFVH